MVIEKCHTSFLRKIQIVFLLLKYFFKHDNKDLYTFNRNGINMNYMGSIEGKLNMVNQLFYFLEDPREHSIEISKANNIILRGNQTYTYDKENNIYVCVTDCTSKEKCELMNEEKII